VGVGIDMGPQEQKFFGSFFQKRTALLGSKKNGASRRRFLVAVGRR
jgi:hypothetical protein